MPYAPHRKIQKRCIRRTAEKSSAVTVRCAVDLDPRNIGKTLMRKGQLRNGCCAGFCGNSASFFTFAAPEKSATASSKKHWVPGAVVIVEVLKYIFLKKESPGLFSTGAVSSEPRFDVATRRASVTGIRVECNNHAENPRSIEIKLMRVVMHAHDKSIILQRIFRIHDLGFV